MREEIGSAVQLTLFEISAFGAWDGSIQHEPWPRKSEVQPSSKPSWRLIGIPKGVDHDYKGHDCYHEERKRQCNRERQAFEHRA